MKNVRKLAALTLSVAMAVSILSGCGGSNSSGSGSTPAAPAAPTAPATTAVAEPVAESTELKERVLNVGYGVAIDTMTPFRSNVARVSPYFLQMYEALAVLNANKEFEPWVAKSWNTDDKGFTYDIEIWDNVSDSAGNKITAADIVWFVEESKTRALKPSFSKVESIEQTGDYSFKLKLTSNIRGTFETLLVDIFVISKAAFEASSDEFGASIVSTSPYVCTEFTASSSMTFERRADYWQDIEKLPECVRPLVKTVNYKIITEASQLGIALETGTVDLVIDIASTTGAQFVGNNDYTVDLSDGPQGWQMFFSGADNSVLANNKELRQAICYGIDANGLVVGLSSGYGTQMYDVCSTEAIGFNEKWKDEDYFGYDIEKAKQLLAESGYNGETIRILGTSSAFSSRLGQLIQNYLVALGIKAELNSVDMALYTSIRLDGTQYDIVLNTIGAPFLSDHWSTRYDPAAYATGDATSRRDEALAALLYKTWTYDGWTEENIDEVHYYLKDNAIAYGLVNPQVFTIWRNDTGMVKAVKGGTVRYIVPSACQFN